MMKNWSIRTWLVALILAMTVPVLVLLVRSAVKSIGNSKREARWSLLATAQVTASGIDQLLADSREILARLSDRPMMRIEHPPSCDPIFSEFHDLYPQYANLGMSDRSGRVVCDAVSGGKSGASVADQTFYQKMMATGAFATGEPFIGPITGKWVVVLNYPRRAPDGTLIGGVGLPLDLMALQSILSRPNLPEGGMITIVDSGNYVIARSTEPERWVGRRFPDIEVIHEVVTHAEGNFEGKGVDGVRRIYGFSPIRDVDWHVYVGVPLKIIMASAYSTIRWNLAFLASLFCAMLILGIYLSRKIGEPVRSLADAAESATRGRLEFPIRPSGPREIAVLGTRFKEMLEARRTTEAALRESRSHLRTIIDEEPECVKLVDREGNLLDMNPAGLRLIQAQSLDQVKGHCVYPLVVDEHREAYRKLHERVLGGETGSLIFDVIGLQGNRLTLETQETPLRNPSGEIFAVLGITRDITERKRAEESLRRALGEVEQLKNQIEAEKAYLQEEIKLEHNFEEIIGRSPNFIKILHEVEQVASTDSTVLILGETGTGKELVARAIHNISPRRERTLVKVNCAALAENLIESELFGHEKGAFTGALSRHIGRFELADGGTLFLDEVGELPPGLQPKLLRVLQDGEFERLGSQTTQRVNVRVIAATNRDLSLAVDKGSFRKDLYFRLNVFPIRVPALRERKEDIPQLVKHFVSKYAARVGKKFERLSNESMVQLSAYHWPGNIRELENVIERAVIISSGPVLDFGDQLGPLGPEGVRNTERWTLRDNEQMMIRSALDECRWIIEGKNGAAARLGIAPSTLRDRIKKYGLVKT
jgi:PAS domain S-box-containing protein